jgi:hydrogenase expression/formation protein HypC
MCLAVPMQIRTVLPGDWADVELGGVVSRVSVALIDGAVVGDYVIVHAGFAIARLDVTQAEETLRLFRQIADHLAEPAHALRPQLP